jgi:cytochrome c oxidase cbb3-type subunit III
MLYADLTAAPAAPQEDLVKYFLALLLSGLPTALPQDLAGGERLFDSQCALCHGIGGTGGRGPALNRTRLQRAPDATALKRIITDGIPRTEMPGAWQLSPREIEHLIAYVQSLSKKTAEVLAGDAAAGERIYAANGCAGCHIVGGRGNGFGPELTAIGARRSAAWLRESVTSPHASVPDAFEFVEIRDRSGSVKGIRVNEDSFSIQIRDHVNRFHSFRKDAVSEIRRITGESPMPAYRLDGKQLEDLTAFLAGLQGNAGGGKQ